MVLDIKTDWLTSYQS